MSSARPGGRYRPSSVTTGRAVEGPLISRTENRERTKAGPGNGNVSNLMLLTTESGVKEMIQSLGLLCLVSLLLALGSLVFLLKILPTPLPNTNTLENLLTDLESRTVHQVKLTIYKIKF